MENELTIKLNKTETIGFDSISFNHNQKVLIAIHEEFYKQTKETKRDILDMLQNFIDEQRGLISGNQNKD